MDEHETATYGQLKERVPSMATASLRALLHDTGQHLSHPGEKDLHAAIHAELKSREG